MSDVATLRSTSGTGFIRTLKASEQHLLRDHLLRLEPASRRDRFNGGISEEFLKTYAARCFEDGTIVIAYIQDGVVRGAAELHAPERSPDAVPEIAFSVESRVRRQGVGSALFEQLLQEAGRKGYASLRITTGGQNEAMKALAQKFGAHLSFRRGEATGTTAPHASASRPSMSRTCRSPTCPATRCACGSVSPAPSPNRRWFDRAGRLVFVPGMRDRRAMSKVRFALPVILLASCSLAHAGDNAIGNTRPAAQAKPAPSAPVRPTSKANPCSEFGPGFVQVEGSTTCVHLGGAAAIGASSGSSH